MNHNDSNLVFDHAAILHADTDEVVGGIPIPDGDESIERKLVKCIKTLLGMNFPHPVKLAYRNYRSHIFHPQKEINDGQ